MPSNPDRLVGGLPALPSIFSVASVFAVATLALVAVMPLTALPARAAYKTGVLANAIEPTDTKTTGGASMPSSLYDFTMKDIDGKDRGLSEFKGQVILLVNTASRCGFTPQYEGLQRLYEKYKDRGFVVLGFPANDFGSQEPGTDPSIKAFCTTKYGVTFPLFAKISVKGETMHPLYRFLTEKATNPKYAGEIGWNFTKFLIDRDGTVINRFQPDNKPDSPEVVGAIENALGVTATKS